MERERIKSSNLYSAGHDETGMEVQFHTRDCEHSGPTLCECGGGQEWHYAGVPGDLYEKFKAARSPGGFFHTHIKMARDPDGEIRYPGRRI